ncbi:MAG: hypothetical protein J2P37_30270, partial [Ktedonobacteraceae bacterium]|nr:hypothetical protein [Ktedonobacteraceae bacterium]
MRNGKGSLRVGRRVEPNLPCDQEDEIARASPRRDHARDPPKAWMSHETYASACRNRLISDRD